MSARFAWFLAGAGIAAVVAYRLTRREAGVPGEPAGSPEPGAAAVVQDPRAEELRRKLAETRTGEDPEPEPSSVEERRRRVHERGRETTERMRRPPEPPAGP